MGSENRARGQFLPVRLDDLEAEWIAEQAKKIGLSRGALARAIIFGRPPEPKVTPCSPNHEHCTAHHRGVVDGYRDQRYREEMAVADDTGLYRGDLDLWEANGGKLTTFADWLQGRTA